jgi:hypothetical protein
MQRVNHQKRYSKDGVCTNGEIRHHHHIAGPNALMICVSPIAQTPGNVDGQSVKPATGCCE